MISYLIRFILCSGLLLLIYRLFLEKEKMYQFNRFYFLFCVVFSLIVPSIKIAFYSPVSSLTSTSITFLQILRQPISSPSNIFKPHKIDNLNTVIWGIYLLFFAFFFVRFLYNIRNIFLTINHNEIVAYKNARLVLLDKRIIPYSFLNCIFIDAEKYRAGEVEKEILHHELTHVHQRHSLDLLFIELIQCLFWFNPFLKFYNNSIRLNHEFLADEKVVERYKDATFYQHLLLSKASQNTIRCLTSPFNYLITKKRLIMINATTSRTKALCKQAVLVPILVGVFFLFSMKIFSQTNSSLKEPNTITAKEPSLAMLNEYDSTLRQMTVIKLLKNGKKEAVTDMSKCDMNRMVYLYKQMNTAQQTERQRNTGISWTENLATKQ